MCLNLEKVCNFYMSSIKYMLYNKNFSTIINLNHDKFSYLWEVRWPDHSLSLICSGIGEAELFPRVVWNEQSCDLPRQTFPEVRAVPPPASGGWMSGLSSFCAVGESRPPQTRLFRGPGGNHTVCIPGKLLDIAAIVCVLNISYFIHIDI